MPSPKPAALPTRLRRVCLLTLGMSACISYGSAQDIGRLLSPPDADAAAAQLSGPAAQVAPPELFRAVVQAQTQRLDALMGFRIAVLMLLSTGATVVFLSAFRLLRPGAVPREGARQILSLSLIVAGVARTLDGAQSASVSQSMAQAMNRAGARLHLPWADGGLDAVAPMVGASALFTLAVVSALLLLRGYFDSPQVKGAVAKLDGTTLPAGPA